MGGHRHRQVGQCGKGGKIAGQQPGQRRVDARQLEMRVDPGPSVPRQMFHHRQNPTSRHAGHHGPPGSDNGRHLDAITAVLQKRMCIGFGDIAGWRAIDVDPDTGKIVGDQPPAQPHRPQRITGPGHLLQRRQKLPPMRGPQPLHPPAFLIDQDRRRPADRVAQSRGQAAQLIGVFDIAGKQDETPGVGVAKETGLDPGKLGAKTAEDAGPGHPRVNTGMHCARSFSSTAQNRRAASSSSKPRARRRKKVLPPLSAFWITGRLPSK